MATVRQVLQTKGKNVFSLSPDSTILDALKLMESKEVGAVLVMEGEKLVGIFSERDYARRGVLHNCSVDTPLNDVMTKKLFYVGLDNSMEECMAQMTDKRIRHLPIVDQGSVVGVISIGDVVKSLISDHVITIAGLENYILGRDYNQ